MLRQKHESLDDVFVDEFLVGDTITISVLRWNNKRKQRQAKSIRMKGVVFNVSRPDFSPFLDVYVPYNMRLELNGSFTYWCRYTHSTHIHVPDHRKAVSANER